MVSFNQCCLRFYQTNFRSNLPTHKMSTILIRNLRAEKFKYIEILNTL